uniref:Uncharacterized protein n=1 Tax=Ananas comosus var. bracteatus TaxID=296719 RepID=A0A6V7PFS7_ANACO|nr:unnamed protein product [Ananas comosus var. bracteatus]
MRSRSLLPATRTSFATYFAAPSLSPPPPPTNPPPLSAASPSPMASMACHDIGVHGLYSVSIERDRCRLHVILQRPGAVVRDREWGGVQQCDVDLMEAEHEADVREARGGCAIVILGDHHKGHLDTERTRLLVVQPAQVRHWHAKRRGKRRRTRNDRASPHAPVAPWRRPRHAHVAPWRVYLNEVVDRALSIEENFSESFQATDEES